MALRHPSPAWCKSSTPGSQPENHGALPGAGATYLRTIVQKENGKLTSADRGALPHRATILHSSVAQKQSLRPISGRPRRTPARRDHGCVAETDQRLAEAEESPARYRTQPPLSKSVIGVTASTAVFQTAGAGAAPAWRTIFKLPKCKRCTPLCEGGSSRCESSREHHSSIPPWQRSAMHSSRKGDHAGAAPAGGSFSIPGKSTGRSSAS